MTAEQTVIAFEDFTPGRTFDLGSTVVDRTEMLDFARRFDPLPYHLDEEAGRNSVLGGLAASGWFTISLWMRAYDDAVLVNSTSEASPGGTINWSKPIFAGDLLVFKLEVRAARRSKSKPHLGVVELRGLIERDGEAIMRYDFVGFFGARQEND